MTGAAKMSLPLSLFINLRITFTLYYHHVEIKEKIDKAVINLFYWWQNIEEHRAINSAQAADSTFDVLLHKSKKHSIATTLPEYWRVIDSRLRIRRRMTQNTVSCVQ